MLVACSLSALPDEQEASIIKKAPRAKNVKRRFII
jgi:hypothetical protein